MFRWRGWHKLQVTFVFAANCIQLELNIQGKKVHNCGFLWGWKFFCLSSFDSLTLGCPCLVPGVAISAWTPLPNPDGGNWLAGSDSQNQTLCRIHRFATWKNTCYFFVLKFQFYRIKLPASWSYCTDLFCTLLQTVRRRRKLLPDNFNSFKWENMALFDKNWLWSLLHLWIFIDASSNWKSRNFETASIFYVYYRTLY